MIFGLLRGFLKRKAPPVVPIQTGDRESSEQPTPNDGRRFAWVYAPQYAKPGRESVLTPVVLFDPRMCGESRTSIVATHKLDPSEYEDDLHTLVARYPAPPPPKDE